MLRKTVIMLAAGTIAALLVTIQTAGGHVRPKGATPLRVSLVPAQNLCAAPNSTHGGTFAFPSCNPGLQTSNFLTTGTPDVNGAPANMVGYLRLVAVPGDMNIVSNITDVRCLPAETAC